MRLSLILPVLLALAPPVLAQDAAAPRPQIAVTGQGSASAVPDMATITLGVTAQAADAADAMAQTSEITDTILARLESFDIAARDIQTSDLSLNPLWSNRSSPSPDGPQIDGFEASNRVTVRVRALDRLGEVLGAVLEDGANRLGGLEFGLQYPEPLIDQARKAAVADAMARAKTYAEAAGLKRGAVLSMSEGGSVTPRPEMAMSMRDAAVSVPTAQGETSMTASVNMIFALED
ncbi:SIMPL domain-containing protein [Thalassococcus sp. BH17M4-6]|uniref:SIMPL domain-containing protein n=1 Tax=Thalassococcus sp. BH17M4-6 TaxID=3413148 RepID=UPI003BEE2562